MLRTIMVGAFMLALVAAIIQSPGESFQSAVQGLSVWWKIVFPGLLPFYALSELLLAFGAIHAVGVLLDPLMHRLFRIPGCAGWVVALGWTAGFPSGPDAAASLKNRGLLSGPEAQRLVALSHMPSPILMLVVIGAGFLHQPSTALTIAAAVWLSGAMAAIISARLSGTARSSAAHTPAQLRRSSDRPSILKLALTAMQDAQERDGRSFGKALGEAISASVQKLLLIGGFMIAGSVLIGLLQRLLPGQLEPIVYPGLFEVHLGAYDIAGHFAAWGTPLAAASLSAFLAWSGMAALLSAQSSLTAAGLRFAPLLRGKLLHAVLAFGATFMLWKPLGRVWEQLEPSITRWGGMTEAVFAARGGSLSFAALPGLWLPAAASAALLACLVLGLSLLSLFRYRRHTDR
ncbi:nucleoside recognition domain-containing protein [Paenibacillus sambharensis]|uniref:Nucleoside recognition domain-containing protein n=1 Tax=Paenibacillus sambharensis TaxID=1803190 RepID=A0A2W1LFR7_9BACL|nr:nucleoside recognition domain-containing protein [Paenibacillus sambharensis]PZD93284.1 nucleoside recognition domain-containing protein [Paenibacillus sambharensis]